MLHFVASLTDDSRGVIYDCNMFIVQSTVHQYLGSHIRYARLPVSVVVSVDDAVEGLLELQVDPHEAGGAVEGRLRLVQHDGRRDLIQLLVSQI
jgi:hypothetical protein